MQFNTSKIRKTAEHPLNKAKWSLWETHLRDGKPGEFPWGYSACVDEYLIETLGNNEDWHKLISNSEPIALVAVGGYGRCELCLESDIDLIFLFEKATLSCMPRISRQVFGPLWDAGFDLGHGTRTTKDCIELASVDFRVLTSLLDMRFITGNVEVFLKLLERLESQLLQKKRRQLLNLLTMAHKERYSRYNSYVNLLEPNLKDGIGGLRDYHHARWVHSIYYGLKKGVALIREGEKTDIYKALMENTRYIMGVRSILHNLARRKQDSLKLEYQPQIVDILGYNKGNKNSSVEDFLADLKSHMSEVRLLSEALTKDIYKPNKQSEKYSRFPSYINVRNSFISLNKSAQIGPMELINFIIITSSSTRIISVREKEYLESLAKTMFENRHNRMLAFWELDKIIEDSNTHQVLDLMLRLNVLELIIPLFKYIKNRVQYDTYHVYPVDTHSIETLRSLENLEVFGGIFEKTVFYELKERHSLLWAALLHDTGKDGKGHAMRGAEKAKGFFQGVEAPLEFIEEVQFLIRNHLYLIETATRKNLSEEKVIVECAREIGTPERAKKLYLLTWADSKATGPNAWTDWTEYLVQDLFIKVLHVLEKGELTSPDSRTRSQENLTKSREALLDLIPKVHLDRIFEAMGIRYALENSPEDIKTHVEMAMELYALLKNKRPGLVLNWKEFQRDGIIELTLVTMDHPGLFREISGVLALHGFNILSARVYTWTNKTAVDILELTYPPDPLRLLERYQRVEQDMIKAMAGELDLPKLITAKSGVFDKAGIRYRIKRAPQVKIDNSTSDFFTVIQVIASDRIGLLFRITNALHENGLDIRLAKIGTKADMIFDVFYVKDVLGQKLTNPSDIERLKESLLEALKDN